MPEDHYKKSLINKIDEMINYAFKNDLESNPLLIGLCYGIINHQQKKTNSPSPDNSTEEEENDDDGSDWETDEEDNGNYNNDIESDS